MKIIAKISGFKFSGDPCEVPYSAYNEAKAIEMTKISDTKLKAYIVDSHEEAIKKLKKQATDYIISRICLKVGMKYVHLYSFKYRYIEIDEDGGIELLLLSPNSLLGKEIFIQT